METKDRRRPRSRHANTVLVIPKQTHEEIERRQRIREDLHDAKAVTVRAVGRTQRKAS